MSLKLEITYELTFDVIGIVSSDREYKLAWLLNHLLQIRLIKQNDIAIPFAKQQLIISHLEFKTEHESIRLIKNKTYENPRKSISYTLPELKNYDFFLLVENSGITQEIWQLLRNSSQIQYASVINKNAIKSKENLFFD